MMTVGKKMSSHNLGLAPGHNLETMVEVQP